MREKRIWFIKLDSELTGSDIYGLYETEEACREAFFDLLKAEWDYEPDNENMSFQECIDELDYSSSINHISVGDMPLTR